MLFNSSPGQIEIEKAMEARRRYPHFFHQCVRRDTHDFVIEHVKDIALHCLGSGSRSFSKSDNVQLEKRTNLKVVMRWTNMPNITKVASWNWSIGIKKVVVELPHFGQKINGRERAEYHTLTAIARHPSAISHINRSREICRYRGTFLSRGSKSARRRK